LLVSIAIFSLIFIPPGYVFAQSQGVPDITSGLENYYFITKNFPEEDGVNISALGIYGDCDGKISKTAEEEKKGKKGNTVDEVPSKDCVFSVDAILIDSPKRLGEGDDAEEPMFDVLCIDDFNLDLTAGWSTCTFITQGDISMSLGVSVDACPHFLGLIGSVLTLGAGWGVCGGTNLFFC